MDCLVPSIRHNTIFHLYYFKQIHSSLRNYSEMLASNSALSHLTLLLKLVGSSLLGQTRQFSPSTLPSKVHLFRAFNGNQYQLWSSLRASLHGDATSALHFAFKNAQSKKSSNSELYWKVTYIIKKRRLNKQRANEQTKERTNERRQRGKAARHDYRMSRIHSRETAFAVKSQCSHSKHGWLSKSVSVKRMANAFLFCFKTGRRVGWELAERRPKGFPI